MSAYWEHVHDFVRTRSTTTRDRNLRFGGAVSTGFSFFSSGFLLLLSRFTVPKICRKLPDFRAEKKSAESCHVSGCHGFFGPDFRALVQWAQCQRSPKTVKNKFRRVERLRGNTIRGNRPERFWEGNLPLRGSLRGRVSEVFRGLQRFLEVVRGFQRFAEVFQRPSQRPSQSAIFLSELRVVLHLIVLPLKTPASRAAPSFPPLLRGS